MPTEKEKAEVVYFRPPKQQLRGVFLMKQGSIFEYSVLNHQTGGKLAEIEQFVKEKEIKMTDKEKVEDCRLHCRFTCCDSEKEVDECSNYKCFLHPIRMAKIRGGLEPRQLMKSYCDECDVKNCIFLDCPIWRYRNE